MPNPRRRVTYSQHSSRAARAAHARGDRQFRTYDTSYIQPKKSKVPMIVALVLALAVVAVAAFFLLRGCSSQEVELLPATEQATVVVAKGDSAKTIGKTLADARLVKSADSFVDLVNKQNAAASLIPGTYVFTGGASPEAILQALIIGPSATGVTLTVPEGYKRANIAEKVNEVTQGRITAQQFLDASADASVYAKEYPFLAEAGTNHLEGFLFPKTYTITAADDAAAVVRMMLDQYNKEIAGLDYAYPESQGLTRYQALNLASIVEKESSTDHKATVASVFYNRLASSRPYLESDATTAYEVGHDPTPEEVHADTPYGTYANPGLPPTPICSPSLESLKAVCSPEQTNYMFFYFKEDAAGVMQYYFSETYDQHKAAIANA